MYQSGPNAQFIIIAAQLSEPLFDTPGTPRRHQLLHPDSTAARPPDSERYDPSTRSPISRSSISPKFVEVTADAVENRPAASTRITGPLKAPRDIAMIIRRHHR